MWLIVGGTPLGACRAHSTHLAPALAPSLPPPPARLPDPPPPWLQLALVLLMITGVHFVEAYGLNPAIYSAHLKLHPLLVLTVLVVAEHSLGVWGLLLAVPLTVFALDYVVSYPDCSATGVASKELENVTASIDSAD